MKDFKDVIALWPSVTELAEDVGENLYTVQKWRHRNSIPSKAWKKLIRVAKKRGYRRVTAEALTRIAAD